MSQGPFGLENAGFWANPFANAPAVMDELFGKRSFGIFADAPAVAYLDVRDTVPLIGCTVLSLVDERSLRFRETAVVVAVREEDGAVFAARAFEPPRRSAPPRQDDPGPGLSFDPFEIDLRTLLALPAKRASYLVAVLARDRVSNRVRVRVEPSSRAYDDAEVAEFVRKLRADAAPREPFPAPAADGGLPSYARRADSPPVPAGEGIALEVERVSLIDALEPLVLRGSFRLPVREQERGRAGGPAVVPITLVLAGAEQPGPFVLPLRVESREPLDENGRATGWFAVDLFALPRMPGRPQTYFVHAFAREATSGPVAMALVTEKTLRSLG